MIDSCICSIQLVAAVVAPPPIPHQHACALGSPSCAACRVLAHDTITSSAGCPARLARALAARSARQQLSQIPRRGLSHARVVQRGHVVIGVGCVSRVGSPAQGVVMVGGWPVVVGVVPGGVVTPVVMAVGADGPRVVNRPRVVDVPGVC